jgi:glucose-1-phosphate thymidylyltransferase
MVFYSLSTLLLAGIRKIVIVADPNHMDSYKKLLGSGSEFGCELTYVIQDRPLGIAHGISLVPKCWRDDFLSVSLGDNVFFGSGVGTSLSRTHLHGAEAFATRVSNPSDFGVVELDERGEAVSIVEKPEVPKSNLAVVGFYIFDQSAYERVERIEASNRGELEITSLLEGYLNDASLKVTELPRGTAWLDTGRASNLARAAQFVEAVEENQGLLVGSPHEIAWRMGWISSEEIIKIGSTFRHSDYGFKLLNLVP